MNWLILGGGTAAVLAWLYYTRHNRSDPTGAHKGDSRDRNGEWPILVKSSRLGDLQLLKTRLDSENVDVILEAEDCGGYGTLPIFVHQLRVPPDQYNVARGILKETDFGKKLVS